MVPFYMRSKVFTMPEFLERRFSPASRTVLSVISLSPTSSRKIAVGIFAGAWWSRCCCLKSIFGDWTASGSGSLLIVINHGTYTIVGGMTAVAYTEALQTSFLSLDLRWLRIFGLQALADGPN